MTHPRLSLFLSLVGWLVAVLLLAAALVYVSEVAAELWTWLESGR